MSESTPAASTSSTLGASTIGLLLAWPIVLVGFAALWVENRTEALIAAAVADAMVERPMIAVIDEAAFVRDQPRTGNNDRDIQAAIARAQETAGKLADSGFIVLNRGAVYRSPRDLSVPTTTTPSND